MSTTIDSLQIEISSNSSNAAMEIDKLATSLANLKNQAKITTVINNLNKLSQALAGLKNSSSGLDSLAKIGESLSGLGNIKTSGLTSTLNNLRQLPEIVNKLDTGTMKEFKNRINEITQALIPLNSQLAKVGKGFSALPSSIGKMNTGLKSVGSSIKQSVTETKQASSGIGGFFNKTNLSIAGVILVARQAADTIGKSVANVNEYIEDMNLFATSMGEFYGEAKEYAELVNDKMGIDVGEWSRNQGVFMSMAKGFGMTKDKAYQLSKGMTEVSYDISSFFNLPIEEAFLKVRSGIAGELEPLTKILAAYIREGIRKRSELLNSRCAAYVKEVQEMVLRSCANWGKLNSSTSL